MYKVAILGDKESVTIYRAAGIDVFPIKDIQETRNVINDLIDKNYGIIFIIEDIKKGIKDIVDRYRKTVKPVIITLPGVKGSSGSGMDELKNAMERAIGVDVLFRNQ